MTNYTIDNLIEVSPEEVPVGSLAIKIGKEVFIAGNACVSGTVVHGYFVNSDGAVSFVPVDAGEPREQVQTISIVDTGVPGPEYSGEASDN